MKLIRTLQTGFKALLLFISVTAVFSVPGLVRCGGSVEPDDKSEYSSVYDGKIDKS